MTRFAMARFPVRLRGCAPANVLILLLLMALPGCENKAETTVARPPLEIRALTVAPRDVPVRFEYVGETESSHRVEIRARIDGYLEKRLYKEGSWVKAGEVMFLMDRRPFEAALQKARGQLAMQEAKLANTVVNLARIRPLAAAGSVSQKALDEAVAQEKENRAAVQAAQATVQEAELNLSYTVITSPVTGLSSQAAKQEGSYITGGSGGFLTTVARIDPLRVNFSISENEWLKFRDEVDRGRLIMPSTEDFEIEVVLADGTVFPQKGRVSFSEPSYSRDTGTFLVRAELDNPKGLLRPGQFVRVRMAGAVRPQAVLIPRRAVMQGAQGPFVWAVNAEEKVEFRLVTLGDWHGEEVFITAGLQAGDRIAVDGILKLAAGMAVKVSPPPIANPKPGGTS
jgi:membrane fusion protein (multidrug efflux system)